MASSLPLTTIEKVHFLSQVDIFANATTEELLRIAGITEEIAVGPNATLFREGDPGDALFFLVSGSARLTKCGSDVEGTVRSREPLGTFSILTREPRLYTATASEPTVALKIEREDFYDLLSQNIEIVQGIFRLLTRRIELALERESRS